jgi:hypothetical protein
MTPCPLTVADFGREAQESFETAARVVSMDHQAKSQAIGKRKLI